MMNKGWAELRNRKDKNVVSPNKANDVEYQNDLARKILAATDKNGKVDMGKVFGDRKWQKK